MIPDKGQKVTFHKELLDVIKFGSRKLAHEYLFLKYLTEKPICIINEVDVRFIASVKHYLIIFSPIDMPSRRHSILLDEEGKYKSSSVLQLTKPIFFSEYIENKDNQSTLYKVPGEIL